MSNLIFKRQYTVQIELRKNANPSRVDSRFYEINKNGDLLTLFRPFSVTLRAYNKQVAEYLAWDYFKFDSNTYMPRSMFKVTAKPSIELDDVLPWY